MIKKVFLVIAAALLLLAFSCAVAEENLAFSSMTEYNIERLENGYNCLMTGGYTYVYSYRIEFANQVPVTNASIEWLSGDEALANLFTIQVRNGAGIIRFNSQGAAVGTAVFRLTAEAQSGSLTRDFSVTMNELTITEPVSLALAQVDATVDTELDLSVMGILNNPDQFPLSYYVAINSTTSSISHASEDADGLRYDLIRRNDHSIFTAHEAGTYRASVGISPCDNLMQWISFNIVATGESAAPLALEFSSDFLRRISEIIETEPIYRPVDGLSNGGMHPITLKGGKTVDGATVQWKSGEQLLDDIFVIEEHGNYYLGFADTFRGTGTATFTLTAFSGEESVSLDFTVTVTDLDMSLMPTQLANEVHAEKNVPLNLNTAGIVGNPGGFEESYRIYHEQYADGGYSEFYSHTPEEGDGLNYRFESAVNGYVFTAYEEGVYTALVRVKFGQNLSLTYRFTIDVEDTGVELPTLSFSSSFLNSLRQIENGPNYLPFDDYSGNTYVFSIYLENNVTPDSATVEWVSGDETLKHLFNICFIGQDQRPALYYDKYAGTGTATFRVTASLDGLFTSTDFSVTVTELDEAVKPEQNKLSVSAGVGEPLILQNAGIITNPAGYSEIYMVKTSNGWSSRHSVENAESLRYSLQRDEQGNSIFTAYETGEYQAFVQVQPSMNLTKTFYFTIRVTDDETTLPTIAFRDFCLKCIKEDLEDGPVYLPFDGTNGKNWAFGIELANRAEMKYCYVKWISGDETLKKLFTITTNSAKMSLMKFNRYEGVGTATFRLVAGSDTGIAIKDFTVTVEELPEADRPILQSDANLTVKPGEKLNLKKSGVVNSNPKGYSENYYVKMYNYHLAENRDGYRFDLIWGETDGKNNCYFVGYEPGVYDAYVEIKMSYNLGLRWYFTITVEEDDSPVEEAVLTPSGIGSVRTFAAFSDAEWTVSDPSVCSVQNGKIRAVGKGTAVVQARNEAGVLLTVNVTVRDMTTLTLPDSLTNLEEEALAGVGAERIILPDSLQSIDRKALINNPNLRVIYIPNRLLGMPLLNDQVVVYTNTEGFQYYHLLETIE